MPLRLDTNSMILGAKMFEWYYLTFWLKKDDFLNKNLTILAVLETNLAS